MNEFRFHLTLSAPLQEEEAAPWAIEVEKRLPELPAPFVVGETALNREQSGGRFELIHRYALSS